MKQEELAALTDSDLLQEAKKMKSTNLYDALFIGLFIGIAIYSTVNNGLGFLTFIPIFYLIIAGKNRVKHNTINKLLIERKLK